MKKLRGEQLSHVSMLFGGGCARQSQSAMMCSVTMCLLCRSWSLTKSVKNIAKHDEIETRIIQSWSVGLRLPMTYIRSRERNTWQGSQCCADGRCVETGHRQDLNIPGAGF